MIPLEQNFPFQSILVYGMGMMGSSLAKTIRKKYPQVSVLGVVKSKKSADWILSEKLADQVFVHQDLTDASFMEDLSIDLLILTLPIQQILLMVPHLPASSCMITDMSSAQREIQEAFQKRPELRFVSSHPLCGSEQHGPQHALENLFQDKICLLADSPDKKSISLIKGFWEALGMKTYFLKADFHDITLAYLSHTPHLLSGLLCIWARSGLSMDALGEKLPFPPVGGGFQDMARIAGSNPAMWKDILAVNSDNIVYSLRRLESEIHEMIQSIENEDKNFWIKWFQKARESRDLICNIPHPPPN